MGDKRTFGEKISDDIARFGGSWSFIFIALLVLSFWVIINGSQVSDFDPYPFILLNLLLSCLAAFQAPFILMSQKRAERKQDLAYRSLFREIKDLVESDLVVEHEIVQLYKQQAIQIKELTEIHNRQTEEINKLRRIIEDIMKIQDME